MANGTTTDVVVMGKKSCVQCDATYRALDKKGIEYSVVDVAQDAAALERVRELGYLQVPVVVAGDDHWSGFRPDRINALSNRAVFDPGAIARAGRTVHGDAHSTL